MIIDLVEQPRQIASFSPGQSKDVYLQLLSGTHAHISNNQQELIDDLGGLQLTPTDGIVWLSWRGQLWVRGTGKLVFLAP